tara:strand:- start:237 stop:482 length:246 start_codon:yes stop_codon:yes gene_type:complete
MPFKVGDILKYHHPSSAGEEQMDLYHFGKDHLDGLLALVLEKSLTAADGSIDYLCYIDESKMWLDGEFLREVKDGNKKSNI